MKESISNDNEHVQTKHAKASRFAWLTMIVLSFAGSIVAQVIFHNPTAAIMLGALSVIGMVLQELYLTWAFGGVPPSMSKKKKLSVWQSIAVRVVLVMAVGLVTNISDAGDISIRAIVFAVVLGAGAAVVFWWQEDHGSGTTR